MYYDKERDELFDTITEINDSILAVTTPSMAENMIVRCLYHIANELHELNNKTSETLTKDTTRDSFEESIANGWIYG